MRNILTKTFKSSSPFGEAGWGFPSPFGEAGWGLRLHGASLLVILLCFLLTSSNRQVTIFMVGDSTMANKDISKGSPERGWGMVLQGCFTENVVVDNHAKNGRSSISFINEGLWQKVLDKMKPGDYVFIQFGHNDEKEDVEGKTPRFSAPGSSFDANLERYVAETRAKGGIPVLFNCVERRLFYDKKLDKEQKTAGKEMDDETLRDVKYSEEKVNTQYLVPTHYTKHGDYTEAPRLVAKRLNVPFVDATTISHHIENDYGVVESRKLHVWLKPGEVASIPDGRKDNTHYSILGAHVMANALVDAIGEQVPALKPFIVHYDYVVSDKGRGNFMTLDEAVAAVPENTPATILVLDGTFAKPNTKKQIKLDIRSTAKVN